MTAALPLSQMSVKRVTAMPVPDGGMDPGTVTASLACSTLDSSMSMPGNWTVGALVMWKVCATLPNVGSTCGVSSVRYRSSRGSIGSEPAPSPRWYSCTSLLVQENSSAGSSAASATSMSIGTSGLLCI
jgi:hypothetical protein